ncbi:hypothetical protein R5R35_014650 [Gryllus longicercus]|uniref:BPTI/Kunitz inhibitor domain-containing protein n=1 Tax=Gryllus longicercus TaxID=2509291 RepID=A0AAN9VLR2_9ORTH
MLLVSYLVLALVLLHEVPTTVGQGSPCRLPKEQGRCRASIYSFYFNPQTGQCESFQYGGCGGNANRFRSKSDCEQRCRRP